MPDPASPSPALPEGARTHELKTWPPYFGHVADGRKSFEVRKNDRGFQPGDWLHLREWDPGNESYTGRECYRQVGYVLWWPLDEFDPDGLCIMELSPSPVAGREPSEENPLDGLPPDLVAVLRDPSVIVSQDAAVFEAIAKWAKAPSNTPSALPPTDTGASTDGASVADQLDRGEPGGLELSDEEIESLLLPGLDFVEEYMAADAMQLRSRLRAELSRRRKENR